MYHVTSPPSRNQITIVNFKNKRDHKSPLTCYLFQYLEPEGFLFQAFDKLPLTFQLCPQNWKAISYTKLNIEYYTRHAANEKKKRKRKRRRQESTRNKED